MGLPGHSYCCLTKVAAVGWGGLCPCRHKREMDGREALFQNSGRPGPTVLGVKLSALSDSAQSLQDAWVRGDGTPGAELLTRASHSGGKRDEARPDTLVWAPEGRSGIKKGTMYQP